VTEGTDSWIVVHPLAYSNESGVSDGPCMSTSSESPEWSFAAYAASGEVAGLVAAGDRGSDQMMLLQGLTQTSEFKSAGRELG
jgi:hypothetical protein